MGGLRGHSTVARQSEWRVPSFWMIGREVRYFILYHRGYVCSPSFTVSFRSSRTVDVSFGWLHVSVCCLVGLHSTIPDSPMLMSTAQCMLLAWSAARAERTETLKKTKTLAKRKLLFVIVCCSYILFDWVYIVVFDCLCIGSWLLILGCFIVCCWVTR